ncbi:TPA: histidinol-phosphate aminotransferase family protein [Yersinia enterocolitica]|uniref:pyridoxal phosphate-dependent aminotransferase n=1 Tax=Yersinia enterocolitica TaxID=630 RepID=UPI00155B1836|nr:histidinol-phosphate transaminase [Yersinia enterocolitica]MBX9483811.1 histidinol-phosphate aminotransferase family protein [Yersinia enterocolitica]MCY1686081.1 histidinol-phosphate aminotransferase family protein [Yersinia enterocolitica]NQS95971.1 histidinol-phosphate aminotransferase family protein [Yersinia enterocolitica]NQT42184.1 histidinol-phosphate aminotransferase family protein [Yersinia enterocolitica]NQU00127.1 histidinol-phosphate aminotransferase family protein [Yersinia en
MDRRTLLKSSGLLLGGLTLGSVIPGAQAKNSKTASQILIPSEQQPLLLNFNENSLGMSPKAHQAIIDALPTAFRYPDAAREQLITNIAAEYQLKTENISLGNGSSETIQAVIQAVIHQAERDNKPIQLVVPDPTFNYAELYAKPFGIPIEKVVLTKEMAFDLPAMQKKVADFNGRSIVYLCNPNNPTATITPADLITAWVKNATPETLFILDEAYAEFVSNPAFSSAISLVQAGQKNVLVTRTFSKIFALAGLRIGYGIAHPELISMVENFVSLDNTNTAGAVAALASLQDKPFVQYSRQSTDQARRIVTQALDQLKLAYLPSEANFVFHRVTGDVKTYQNRMKQYHVFVGREFPPAVGWNRLTLGTPEEMIAFVTVLKMFRTKGWV